jgi:PKD repeat protein
MKATVMKNRIRSCIGLVAFGLVATSALAQSAVIIPPRFLPDDRAIRLSSGDQVAPEIASGGSAVLAVWQDKRAFPTSLPFPSSEWETSSDIYGMRLDADGQPLDRAPLVVTQEAASQSNPQVVWNGTNWLVVFESVDINGTGFYFADSLEAVRISPDGVVLDSTPIKIRNVSPAGSSWTVASDGNNWVVAFQESDANSAVALLRITPAGEVLQGPKVVVPSTYFLRSNFKLAFANGVFLLTWAEFSDTQALRFDSNLTVLGPGPFRLITGHIVTDLTSNGTQFYAVWLQPVAFVDQVTGSRISTAGVVLDGGGNGVVISNNSSKPDAFTGQFVSWDGTNFRVTWASNNKLFGARVSATGTVLDPGGDLIPGPMSGPTASTGNGNLHVAWSVLRTNEYDTLTANISPVNVASPNRGLGIGRPAQTRSDVAMGTNGSMIVFRSDISGRNRIMVQPLDLNGNPLTPGPTQLQSGPTFDGPGEPSIAWNGSVYLATWGDTTGIVAQRVNQDGTLVDPAPFPVMPGFGPTEVSGIGDVFLVIARKFINNNPELIEPFVARVNGTTGAVLDPNGISVGPSFCVSVSVTTFADRWLTVFRSNANHDEETGTTYGNFVNADGTRGNAFPIFGPSAAPGNGVVEVAVGSNGTNAISLQSAPLSSTTETDLVAVIVNSNGTHGPGINLTPWEGNQYSPAAAWNGTHYVVTFNDQINRFAVFTLDQLDARSDLVGMRVAADGTKIDPMGFVFSASPAAESWTSVTAGNGLTLITGSVMLNRPFDAYRIGYRLLGIAGNQWPVAVATANTEGGDIPLSVTFNSAGTTDLDGNIVSYLWDFGDGTSSTAQNPQHTYTTPGKYVVTLTVTDNLGATSTDTVSLEASAPNIRPVSKFIVTPPGGSAPLDVVLTSDESYDPDGAIGNRHWTFSDGGDYWGETAFHTFSRPGTYRVTLTVFDNENATGISSQTVVVTQ